MEWSRAPPFKPSHPFEGTELAARGAASVPRSAVPADQGGGRPLPLGVTGRKGALAVLWDDGWDRAEHGGQILWEVSL